LVTANAGGIRQIAGMRTKTDKAKLLAFMAALGQRAQGQGRIYLAGGATAVWHGWRAMTIDIDFKPDMEPAGLFEALAGLKHDLDINFELACPDQIIPELCGWRERSLFIARHGPVDVYHYDPYSQTLAKIQRGHERDLRDARDMVRARLVEIERLRPLYAEIEPRLLRYPAIEPGAFRAAVEEFCRGVEPIA
jgi:hypothetical protein